MSSREVDYKITDILTPISRESAARVEKLAMADYFHGIATFEDYKRAVHAVHGVPYGDEREFIRECAWMFPGTKSYELRLPWQLDDIGGLIQQDIDTSSPPPELLIGMKTISKESVAEERLIAHKLREDKYRRDFERGLMTHDEFMIYILVTNEASGYF